MNVDLPYFDACLDLLSTEDATLEALFGSHVHWGYWENPNAPVTTADDFAQASDRLVERLFHGHAIPDGGAHLDAGCGFGGTIHWLDGRTKNARLVGLNIDARQLERARAQVSADPTRGNRLEWIQGDACALPFADATFDTLSAVECIFHFPSRRRFFEEARRVLKPGGWLVLSDFVLNPWRLPMVAGGYLRHGRALRSVYGSSKVAWLGTYRSLARRTGWRLERQDNVTAHTLPTYRYLAAHASRLGHRLPHFVEANGFLARASAREALQYHFLAFRRG